VGACSGAAAGGCRVHLSGVLESGAAAELKGDPFHVGEENKVSTWAEFLQPETAKPLAFYDHPFFGRWPAVTSNVFGSGTLIYEGTALSDKLQEAIVLDALGGAGLTGTDQQLPSSVRVKHGIGREGRKLHYYLNYSGSAARLAYTYADGADVLTGEPVAHGQQPTVAPWDLLIIKEKVKNR
jgi:beta-galactosidase